MKNVRQLSAHFYLCPGLIIRAIMARISNFGPSWSEVPGMKNVDQLGPHFNFRPSWAEVLGAENGDHHGHKKLLVNLTRS